MNVCASLHIQKKVSFFLKKKKTKTLCSIFLRKSHSTPILLETQKRHCNKHKNKNKSQAMTE